MHESGGIIHDKSQNQAGASQGYLPVAKLKTTRAKSGIAFIITEIVVCATQIDPLRARQNLLRIDDDHYRVGMARLANAVHNAGAKIGVQLSLGFGAQARGGPWEMGRQVYEEVSPVSSSNVPSPRVPKPPRALSTWEVESMVELYGRGAMRVADAGFDFIELHAHSGHLIAQFLSPYFNKRTDKYGGDFDGRFRLLRELIEVVHTTVGQDFPLECRFSIDEFIPGGRTLQDGQKLAQYIEKAGVNAINVSAGIHGAKIQALPTMYHPDGTFLPLAKAVKDVVKIPVFSAGKLGNPEIAEKALRDGVVDFVLWGRPLICDPELPKKVAEGRTDEIRRCIACNSCSLAEKRQTLMYCAVNPVAGFERWYGTITKAEKPKKVIVVGAGPGGMEAARAAALKGHDVTIYDKGSALGGLLGIGSVPPHKESLTWITNYYTKMFQLNHVKVVLNKEVTADMLIKEKPDAVILATGGEPIIPDFPKDGAKVINAYDLLRGDATAGDTVVVIGGGLVGMETADFLAAKGKKVTIVEMLKEIGTGLEARNLLALKTELSERNVKVATSVKVEAINSKGVVATDSQGKRVNFPADTVVLACGVKTPDSMQAALAGKIKDVFVVGDASKPGLIRDAVSAGFMVVFHNL